MAASTDALFPDIAAQEMAAQRQLALSQMLMQQGQQPIQPNRSAGRFIIQNSPMEGLANLAKTLVGLYGQQKASDSMVDLGKQRLGQLGALVGMPSPGSDPSGASSAAPPTIDMTQQPDGTYAAPSGGPASVPGSSPPGTTPATPTQALQMGETGGSMGPTKANASLIGAPVVNTGAGPLPPGALSVPGMNPRSSMLAMALAPDQYIGGVMKQYEQTPEMKNLAAAYGQDSPQYRAGLAAILQKSGSNLINVRPGGTVFNGATGQPTFAAPSDGGQIIYDAAGHPTMAPVAGAAPVKQTMAYAQTSGQGLATPQAGFRGTEPVFTNRTAAAGGNLLDNPQLAGPAAAPPPMAAVPAPAPVTTAPLVPGRFAGYQAPGQPAPAAAAPVAPSLGPGVGEALTVSGKGGADRANALIGQAADSQTRVNVLDNILQLSKEGVATGPGQDWQNKLAGYVANAPGISSIPGVANAKDNIAKFQEMQKFLTQNGLRAWQAAGGTGTDAQMEQFTHANPNDAQFPQALQAMAKWGKAGELALQAKANAQDKFLTTNTPDQQAKFETSWRNNFDPRVYQMKLMDPAELQQFSGALSPADRTHLLQKYQWAKGQGLF